jgi:glycosidase
MPKLRTSDAEVRELVCRVGRFWVEEYGTDGWRLDVANEVSQDFWRKFRKAVKGAKPDAVIIGEVWDNAAQWLKGDEFDAVMNYPFRGATLDFFAHGKLDGEQFAGALETVRGWYSPAANAAMLNLLGSHDTARLLTEAGGDAKRVELATFFQMTYPGSPSIYYGDEIGLAGANDPWNRAPMPWDKARWNTELQATVRKAVALRNAHPALRGMDIETLYAPKGGKTVAFLRRGGGETMITAFNAGDTDQTFSVALPQGVSATRWKDAWRGGTLTAGDGTLSITLGPLSGTALMAEVGS